MILARAKPDAWESKIKLFKSIPTLLYGVQVWGPGYLEFIELAQADYFKQILQLPNNTPGYVLRLQLCVDVLAVEASKLTLGCINKIIKLNNNRLPKICLARLIELTTTPDNTSRFNWVSSATLHEAGMDNRTQLLQQEIWASNCKEIIKMYS